MQTIGIIGFPLGHSFSPTFFKKKFHALGLSNWEYKVFEIQSIQQLDNLIQTNKNLVALNVTIPHKVSVLDFVSQKSSDVDTIGACNCLLIDRFENGYTLRAENTDWSGFKMSLMSLEKSFKNALLLGNGGASLAVQYALKSMQVPFDIITRNGAFNYQNLSKNQFANYDLIINTTPVGTDGNSSKLLELPYSKINSGMLFYDLVYNPSETEMMKIFTEKGASAMNGYKMLENQANLFWQMVQDFNAKKL